MANSGDTNYCNNCKRHIAAENFVMHEVHCKRNIVLCKKCDEPVPKSELDDHYEEYHVQVQCEKCGKSMEKSLLEEHPDNCSKRRVTCSYCELEMGFDELKSHMEYCGTRTEPCVSCGQYIMHKDRNRHEDSNCSYPTPAITRNNITQANQPTNNSRLNNTGYENYTEMNGFAVDEIQRMINMTSIGDTDRINRFEPSITRNFSSTSNNARGPTNRPPKQSNQRANRARHSPDLNDLRSYENIDELLARHLAQDLSTSESNSGIGVHGHYPMSRSPPTTSDLGNMVLPCEFCDDLFPADDLYQHQSACMHGQNVYPLPEDGGATQPASLPNNARELQETRSHPPVVDNLGYLEAQEWVSHPIPSDFTSYDDIMLPCEFCDNQFPEEILIQHQAICDANLTQTPRVRTPNMHTQQRPTYGNHNQQQQRGRASKAWPANSRRRQGDPVFDGDREEAIGASPSRYRSWHSRLDEQQKKANYGSGASRSQGEVREQRSEFGRTFTTRSQWSTNETEDADRTSARRKNSATKVRQTLDELVSNPTATTHDLVAQLEKEEKMNRNIKQKADKNGMQGARKNERRTGGAVGRTGGSSYQPSFAIGGSTRHTKSKQGRTRAGSHDRADADVSENQTNSRQQRRGNKPVRSRQYQDGENN